MRWPRKETGFYAPDNHKGLVQGIIVGGVLAFITANHHISAEANPIQTTINDWTTTMKSGAFGNGILLQAICAEVLPTGKSRHRQQIQEE